MKLWIRIDSALPRDPDVQKLSKIVQIRKAETVGLLTCLWGVIAEHRPSGDISDLSPDTIEEWAEFEPRGRVKRGAFAEAFLSLFTTDGYVRGWKDRQGKLIENAEKDRARKQSKRPTEPTEPQKEPPQNSEDFPRTFRGNSTATERTGRDGTDGTERNVVSGRDLENSGEDRASPVSSSLNGTSPSNSEPRVKLPREAVEFLARYYESTGGESEVRRYRDIQRQLYEVLDPLHIGVKIRGGARVKARSVEHLVDCIAAVNKNPPPNRDHAILWLLNKLLDPPKGPSETDKKKRQHEEEINLENRYFAAAKSAGIKWAKDHDDEYQKILVQVEANFKGQTNSFAKMARESQLTQLTAKAAGFPKFETWLERQKVPA